MRSEIEAIPGLAAIAADGAAGAADGAQGKREHVPPRAFTREELMRKHGFSR